MNQRCGVCLALADAVDSMEDANFDPTTTETFLVRLRAIAEWCKEMIGIDPERTAKYRLDENFNSIDRMFESAINRSIQLTDESCETTLYKDVLKYGFFELQILLLAPICPHICEYIYQYLHPGRTIMNVR